jgi:DegV family protein with EDD domain
MGSLGCYHISRIDHIHPAKKGKGILSVRIVTDSTCDLPDDVIKALEITVVPLYINIGEKGYLDGVDISRRDFYTNLPNYEVHPTTATPSIETFVATYKKLADMGADEILSIHISESLSATVKVAESAAGKFKDKPVAVRDSQQLSMGTGFQVELAGKMAMDGKSMQDILHALDDLMPRIFVTAGLDTLEFLRRSGRMNVFLAGIGSLLQLKPILTMRKGQPGSEQVRTTKKANKRLIEMLKSNLPLERFALLHTNAANKAEALKNQILDVLPNEKIFSMDITPVIGAHLGPGAAGYALVSERTT